MSEKPAVIDLWRMTVYICFYLGVAVLSIVVLEKAFGSHQWLFREDARGRSLTWVIAIILSYLAGKLLDRVFPLVPKQKEF